MELIAFFKWILMCFMVSCFMRPFLHLKNLKLWDRGFALSLGFGISVSFFVAWFISAVTPIKYDTPVCYASLAGCMLIAVCIKYVRKSNNGVNNIDYREAITKYLLGFGLFVLLFAIAVWVKGFKPEISCDTEKYMDFGFLQSIYRQKSAVPEDLWFAGKTLNYYYLGQSMVVFLCRLAFITPEYGYNFMLCSIFALSFCMLLFMAQAFICKAFETSKFSATIGGLCAALLACCGGNGHYIIYGIIDNAIKKINGNGIVHTENAYFFPDSTVFIGYNPETMDKGKHEFLSYTLVLGDLHAHAINVIFVIVLIAILLDYALEDCDRSESIEPDKYRSLEFILKILSDARIYMLALLLGLFRGSNYWDFPIYFIVSGAVILFCDYKKYGISIMTTGIVLLKGFIIFTVGTIMLLPFTMHFEKMISGIYFTQNSSPFYKMIILWGFPIVACLCFAFMLLLDGKVEREIKSSSLSMIAIVLCAIGLVILPEIIYVKDIYGEEYARFNTMFKLTYQAFTLFSICTGIFIGFLCNKKKRTGAIVLGLITILLATYMPVSVYQYIGNIFEICNRKGCSSLDAFYNETYYEEGAGPSEKVAGAIAEINAAKIINSDNSEHIHIMEKYGHSYSPECKLSVFTGASNVAGWEVHEWMWRNNWDIVAQREGEIAKFYTCGDPDYCQDIIDKYDLEYIFVGPAEINEFDVNYEGFSGYCQWMPVSVNQNYALYKVIK